MKLLTSLDPKKITFSLHNGEIDSPSAERILTYNK